jgi:uncharacterized protein (DUF4415 family)
MNDTTLDDRKAALRARIRADIKSTTEEEDAAIHAAALSDPDNPPLTEDDFKRARPGRPPLPPEKRKKQVTMLIDPDVLEALKKDGKGWQTRANAALRKAVLGE